MHKTNRCVIQYSKVGNEKPVPRGINIRNYYVSRNHNS